MTVTTYREAAERNAANRRLAMERRAALERIPGGLAAFRASLAIVPIRDPGQTDDHRQNMLDAYFRVLGTGILPTELVPEEDFRQVLTEKNEDTELAPVLGPFQYFSLAVVAPEVGMIGAVGFAVFCHRHGPATLHGSYYVVVPEYRACGISRTMLNAVAEYAIGYIAEARPQALDLGFMLQFIEANDIGKMTLGERLLDEAMALHPLDRDMVWERQCFGEISEIDYQQRADPPIRLSLKVQRVGFAIDPGSGRSRDIRFERVDAIAAAIVLRHVTAFDSVLMNFDAARAAVRRRRPLTDPRLAGLLGDIDEAETLAILSMAEAAANRGAWAAADARLREALAEPLPLHSTMQELSDSTIAHGSD